MAELALSLYLLYLALAFGLRTLIQRRRTGSTGFVGLRGPAGSAEWWGGVLFVLALLFGLAAPVADLLEVVDPIAAVDSDTAHALGVALALAGIGLTLYAQLAMLLVPNLLRSSASSRSSWRSSSRREWWRSPT